MPLMFIIHAIDPYLQFVLKSNALLLTWQKQEIVSIPESKVQIDKNTIFLLKVKIKEIQRLN